MSVAVNQPGIDYHVVLAQNALQQCLDMVELQAELICTLVKQTSRHTGQKLGVGVQVNKRLGKQTRVSCWRLIVLFIFLCFFLLLVFWCWIGIKYLRTNMELKQNSKFIFYWQKVILEKKGQLLKSDDNFYMKIGRCVYKGVL